MAPAESLISLPLTCKSPPKIASPEPEMWPPTSKFEEPEMTPAEEINACLSPEPLTILNDPDAPRSPTNTDSLCLNTPASTAVKSLDVSPWMRLIAAPICPRMPSSVLALICAAGKFSVRCASISAAFATSDIETNEPVTAFNLIWLRGIDGV